MNIFETIILTHKQTQTHTDARTPGRTHTYIDARLEIWLQVYFRI